MFVFVFVFVGLCLCLLVCVCVCVCWFVFVFVFVDLECICGVWFFITDSGDEMCKCVISGKQDSLINVCRGHYCANTNTETVVKLTTSLFFIIILTAVVKPLLKLNISHSQT